jgi:enamine deaminase RidA (YjgF/YER057c/UK114 family)
MSQAVRVGDTLYISGQVAFDAAGDLVGADDPKRQAEQCFRNIEAVLAAAGSKAAEVVKLTCYLVEVAHYPAYAEAKARFLDGVAVPPAGTAVVVAGLLVPGLLMEVEAVAILEEDQPS